MGLHPFFREDFNGYTSLDRVFSGDQGSQSVSGVLQYRPWVPDGAYSSYQTSSVGSAYQVEPQQPSLIGCLPSADTHGSTNRDKAWETASDPVSHPTQSPSPSGGLEAGPSAGQSSASPTANENAAAQGSVSSPGYINTLMWFGKPDTDALWNPLTNSRSWRPTLEALGLRNSPLTFSSVMFTGEDEAVRILKHSHDLPSKSGCNTRPACSSVAIASQGIHCWHPWTAIAW